MLNFTIKPNTTPLTLIGSFCSFNEAANLVRGFLDSAKQELHIPIDNKDYPEFVLIRTHGLVTIRAIEYKGVIVDGGQKYLEVFFEVFNFFDANDNKLNTATISHSIQDQYINKSSVDINIEAIP